MKNIIIQNPKIMTDDIRIVSKTYFGSKVIDELMYFASFNLLFNSVISLSKSCFGSNTLISRKFVKVSVNLTFLKKLR